MPCAIVALLHFVLCSSFVASLAVLFSARFDRGFPLSTVLLRQSGGLRSSEVEDEVNRARFDLVNGSQVTVVTEWKLKALR